MLTEPTRIHIAPDSELARLLEEAGDVPLLLEKNGKLYRIIKEDDIWAGYDPNQVKAVIRKTAGSWADIDADKLISDLYRAREEGSRPVTRP
jgi:hypothetical protein